MSSFQAVSFQAVSYGEFKRALHKFVGLSVSKEVFTSHGELMWNLYYYLNLDFHALSSMDLSDEPSAAERRLKEIARVLIDFINLTSAKHNVRLYQHGTAIRDAVSLSNVCKDMAAILSTQEAKLVNKVAKITELVTKIAELEEQLRSSNTTVESQRCTIVDLNSEVATVFAQNLDANDEIRDQGLQIQHQKDQITHLEKTVALNDDTIYNMEHQLVDLQDELQVLQDTMTHIKRKYQDQNTVGSPSDVTEVDVSHPNKSPKLTDAFGAGSSLFDSTPESIMCESEVDEESEEEKESEDEADNPNVDGSTVESAFPILDNPELPYSD